MISEPGDLGRIAEALEALRGEVAHLGERVAALEARGGTPAPPVVEPLSEELVMVIGGGDRGLPRQATAHPPDPAARRRRLGASGSPDHPGVARPSELA